MWEVVPVRLACPYCGELIEVLLDSSAEQQAYIEDCSVCCRPISLEVVVSGDEVTVSARDENEV